MKASLPSRHSPKKRSLLGLVQISPRHSRCWPQRTQRTHRTHVRGSRQIPFQLQASGQSRTFCLAGHCGNLHPKKLLISYTSHLSPPAPSASRSTLKRIFVTEVEISSAVTFSSGAVSLTSPALAVSAAGRLPTTVSPGTW